MEPFPNGTEQVLCQYRLITEFIVIGSKFDQVKDQVLVSFFLSMLASTARTQIPPVWNYTPFSAYGFKFCHAAVFCILESTSCPLDSVLAKHSSLHQARSHSGSYDKLCFVWVETIFLRAVRKPIQKLIRHIEGHKDKFSCAWGNTEKLASNPTWMQTLRSLQQ